MTVTISGDDHDHDHDHEDIGGALDTEGEYQKMEDEPQDQPQEAIEIKAEEGGFMAVAADPEKQKELQNAPKLDLGKKTALILYLETWFSWVFFTFFLDSEGPALGFDLQSLAGSGTVDDELRRLYNYITQINQQYRCPQDKIEFVGTDKKYFMDFSYPICFETEKFWKPSAEGCLVYSFGVDDNWKFAEGMKDHSQG